jgi:hypothetical protein
MEYNFPCRNPVVDTTTGSGSLVATLPATADKFNYCFKVIGYTDLAGVVTIATDTKDSIVFYAAANTTFNIDLNGWYKSANVNKAITATVASTTNGSITIIGEAL